MIATQYISVLSPSRPSRLQYDLEPGPPCKRSRLWDSRRSIAFSNPNHSTTDTFTPLKMSDFEAPAPCSPRHASEETITNSTAGHHALTDPLSSEDDSTPAISVQGSNGSRTSSHGSHTEPQIEHIIQLSSIEHCMPRAYIRICLAYRVPSDRHLEDALSGLRRFVDQVIEAKPYLAGNVTDVKQPNQPTGRAEIRFTTKDYYNHPRVVRKTLLNKDGSAIKYDDLMKEGLPPSRMPPGDVSALPPNVDPSELAPVFRIQGNLVDGGLIVSIYLHHCVSDGTGFDLLTSGDVLKYENFAFSWPQTELSDRTTCLERKLKAFAREKSIVRQSLSHAQPTTVRTRELQAKHVGEQLPQNKPGRGCIVMISAAKILTRIEEFNDRVSSPLATKHTKNSVLMALLWRHMTRARRPAIAHNTTIKTSKLLIPVDIRGRLGDALPAGYFGAAVDFGKAELDIETLANSTPNSLKTVSSIIRRAILNVNDAYIREAIRFANEADASIDVHDLQASNMDRVNAADMYITSWLKLRTYHHDLGMGLGGPDWVRKPWSRDPGSCILLPRKPDSGYFEVVVQMTEDDMSRLLEDQEFMEFVDRVID